MDFLEKLNTLMIKNNLNKSTLSKACGIPYTTIDGWYKKGYEGLKLTTLRRLSAFFGTSLDFWANDQPLEALLLDDEVGRLARHYRMLNPADRELMQKLAQSLAEKASDSPKP